MTPLGKLGKPCIAIGIFWVIPEAPNGPETAKPPAKPDPDDMFIRELTGMDALSLRTKLQELGNLFQEDPEALRAFLTKITDGDDIATQWAINLIRIAQGKGDPDDADDAGDEPGDEPGQVLPFARPAQDTKPDNSDDDSDEPEPDGPANGEQNGGNDE